MPFVGVFQEYPAKKDYVRAVSLLTGYLIQNNGANCCTLYYLTQVDPRGEHFYFFNTAILGKAVGSSRHTKTNFLSSFVLFSSTNRQER